MHRWAIVERWEADVTPGDPTLETAYGGGFKAIPTSQEIKWLI